MEATRQLVYPPPRSPIYDRNSSLPLTHVSILRACRLKLSTMDPIVRDYAYIKSFVPFPSTNNSQAGAPPEPSRQRTVSNSSSSSSSGLGTRHPRPHGTSMSGRKQKQLSPVAEEFEDDHGRRRLTSTSSRVRSRASYRPKPRPASYIGQTGLTAENLTIAMMTIPPPPPRHRTKSTARRGPMSKTMSSFSKLRRSIRARLPTLRLSRVWRR